MKTKHYLSASIMICSIFGCITQSTAGCYVDGGPNQVCSPNGTQYTFDQLFPGQDLGTLYGCVVNAGTEWSYEIGGIYPNYVQEGVAYNNFVLNWSDFPAGYGAQNTYSGTNYATVNFKIYAPVEADCTMSWEQVATTSYTFHCVGDYIYFDYWTCMW
jgi:hypothetical protein